MMNENRYYNNATQNIYCGKKCTTNKDYLTKPILATGASFIFETKQSETERNNYENSGYTFKGPSYFDGVGKYGIYYEGSRDPTKLSFWEKILTAFNKPTRTSTDVDNFFKCCNGLANTQKEKDECGSLLFAANDKSKSNACLFNMRSYCSNPVNMLEERCITQITNDVKSGYETENKVYNLDTVCKDKQDTPKWDKLCACNYSFDFYDSINKKIAGEWNIPKEYISPLPECMYPKCAASNLRNFNAKCPTSSFTQCIQNNNLDISNSSIGAIEVKQTGNCVNYTKKNNTPNTNTTNANTNTPNTNTNKDKIIQGNESKESEKSKNAEKSKNDAKKETNYTTYFIMFIIIVTVLGIVIGIIVAIKNKNSKIGQVSTDIQPTQPIT